MDTDDQLVIALSGEGPWGFRLQGGSEKKLPLLVSKVRKRSKACRGGLREKDEVVSINGKPCASLSHAGAMQLIDSAGSRLQICVKRESAAVTAGEQRALLSPTPGVQAQKQKQLQPLPLPPSPERPHLLHRGSITSPPDSEGYYGETDSDADTLGQRPQELGLAPQEKHRRARKRSPRSPPQPQSMSEMSGYDSAPEPARQIQRQEVEEATPKPIQNYAPWRNVEKQQHRPAPDSAPIVNNAGGGVAKREIVYQPSEDNRAETPFSDVEGCFDAADEVEERPAPSPEDLLLPKSLVKSIRAERPLIPMVGPVDHPVDEDLTTSYVEKAKEAMLHRSESVQEKHVKEAKTKCKTIASLLTSAPNPHSKGVLMFKKRRQRAKKYTLISYGSVDEDRYEDEDGIFPTSESEFDEEGFSDARSLTNHSDWDNTYLDIEKPKMESASSDHGLSEASGKGAKMFEQQRQKSARNAAEQVPHQTPERPMSPPANVPQKHMTMNGEGPPPQSTYESHVPGIEDSQVATDSAALFNRSARPFTPGASGQRPVTTSVIFRPTTPKKKVEIPSVQSTVPPPFSVTSPGAAAAMQISPQSTKTSTCVAAPSKPAVPLTTKLSVEEIALDSTLSPTIARTTTTSIYLSNPARPTVANAAACQQAPARIQEPITVTPGTSSTSLYISPSPPSQRAHSVAGNQPYTNAPQSSVYPAPSLQPTPDSMASREQRIAVPAARTGILQEARKRGSKKPLFSKVEEKPKHTPNPELLSLVQNLDGRPKNEAGAGFESGPEEDFLSLGAEACNFMQSPSRRFKTPPPVAPKPRSQSPGIGLVNGTHDMPQMGGRGAELFAKRQSRMDKYVVESTPSPSSRPRTPSPTPSMPSSWKYSSNIRAPPPIGYNPLLSPFCPLAASKAQSSKVESKVKKTPSQKPRLQAIDFMKHQPYQLNSAMFCYGGSPNVPAQNTAGPVNQKSNLTITPARQVPVKTVRTYEIKRFSTPTPMSSSTSLAPVVIKPRSATALDEPMWRTEVTSPPPPSRTPPPVASQHPAQGPQPFRSVPDFRGVGVYNPSSPITSPQSSVSGIQVARPRFSPARTGIQANIWRPASVRH